MPLLCLLLVCGGLAGWYFVGGGKMQVQRFFKHMAAGKSHISPKQSLEMVRQTRGGPSDMTVKERLEVLAAKLQADGKPLTERRWKSAEDPSVDGYLVTCTLHGEKYDRQLTWVVDFSGATVTAQSADAQELDTMEVPTTALRTPSNGAVPVDYDMPDTYRPGPGSAPRATPGKSTTPPAGAGGGTTPDIELLGVFGGQNSGKYAVLRDLGGASVSVRTGGVVSGWKVADIQSRAYGESSVTLKRGKQTRELTMVLQSRRAPVANAAPPPPPRPAPPQPEHPEANPPPGSSNRPDDAGAEAAPPGGSESPPAPAAESDAGRAAAPSPPPGSTPPPGPATSGYDYYYGHDPRINIPRAPGGKP